MKKIFTLAIGLSLGLMGFSQYYYLPSVTPGNPGGLNMDDEYPGASAGWSSIMGTSASPTWSSSQTIPFTFNFNGAPVTSYSVSSTGVVTFNGSPGTAPGVTAAALPDASIPDNSICAWGSFQMTGSNDEVLSKTFGSAGSQQHWIFWTSISNPSSTSCWAYWAIVLEEGSDNIYVVDMRNACSVSKSVGIQIDGTTAISVAGSPNVDTQSDTDPTAVDNFYYTFIYGTQPAEDVAGIEMTTNEYNLIANSPFDIEGDLMNMGSATITSMDINYSVDGAPAVTQNVTGLNIATFDTYSFTHGTPWNAPSTGSYTVEVWASNINGNADANTANDIASGTVQVFNNFTQRIPLYETFTSSTCGPCVAGNQNLEGIFATTGNAGKYTSVKYQSSFPGSGDPYCTTESTNRRNYYGINSIPRLEVDGGWDNNASSMTQQLFDDFYAIPSFVDLTATYSVTNQTIQVDVDIDPVETLPSTDLVVHMAVIEYETFNNTGSNGETEFAHVMKKMLPDEDGSPISQLQSGVQQTASQTYTFQGNYRLPNNAGDAINHAIEHSIEEFTDLGVVVWVQDENTAEVYQSAMASLVNGVDNENTQLLTAKIYPNPVQDNATIAFHLNNSADVMVSIYNQFGQLVSHETYTGFGSGRSTVNINTSELANGMYTVVLNSNNERLTKKMTIAK